jgi:hypothetical protein
MSSELNTYKKNRIDELKNQYKIDFNRLNTNLNNNIKIINKSKLKPNIKRQNIQKLINQYNNNIKSLNNTLNNNISIINSFNPKPIIISGRKKALLIGINYLGTVNELNGCINDINRIQTRISNNGFSEINILTDNTVIKPTKDNILNAFTNLLVNSQAGDMLFFVYSGHGSYKRDTNNDEKTGYDQMIIPIDLNPIIDDNLKSIIQQKLKEGVSLFALFDSCFSGSVLDLRYQYMDSLNYDNYTENVKQLETQGNVFMISGCTDYQTSADSMFNNIPNGAMTWSLLEALNQKQNQSCSCRELLKMMRNLLKSNGFDQIPQFSTGKFENIDTQIFI